MANGQLKSVAGLLLVLNFCMYAIVLGIGSWAMNMAIEHGFVIGKFIFSMKILCISYAFLTSAHTNTRSQPKVAYSC